MSEWLFDRGEYEVGLEVVHDLGAAEVAGHIHGVQRAHGQGRAVLHQAPHAPQVTRLYGALEENN
jgi:hypothetical protein